MTDRRSPVLLLVALLILLLGCNLTKKLFGKKGKPVSTVAPALSAPPARAASSSGTPEAQATYYADLLAAPATRLSGWLGLYDALGIPVVGQNGAALGTTADDPIGPRYWQIWYASGLDTKGRGLPLTDAGRLIGSSTPKLDGKAVGAALLEDLRQALKSSDPQIRLMGSFVKERIKRWPSHLDIQDAKTTADKAIIDLPTVQMILWIAARGALMRGGTTGAIERPTAGDTVPAMFFQGGSQPASSKPCSESLGSSDATYWTNWLANKAIGGGVQLPGMTQAFKGLVEQAQIAGKASQKAIEKTSAMINKLNVAAALLSLLLQLAAMEIEPRQDPAPLERTKGTSRGKEGTIELQLFSSPGKIPNGNEMAACMGSFLSNAFGISFSFPAEGPISGAEMTVEAGKGIPDLVLFNSEGTNSMRRYTDGNGVAEYKLFGAPQKKQIPESAKEQKKEFSVHVTAQPEEVNGKTMLNIFFGGLVFGAAPGAPAGLTSAIDIAKSFQYDMGEYIFDLKDWHQGYRASGQDGSVVYSGVICSLEKPFKVTGTHPIFVLPLEFAPSSPTSGTTTYSMSLRGVTSSGNGPYSIEGADTDAPQILVKWRSTARAPKFTTSGAGDATIKLTPLESDECK